ncbi:MAG: hypothetical protein RL266_919 [Bacteroidota bacterium]|jgi:hypothetical protein
MIIQWDSDSGKYRHRCDACGVTFHGRKNQHYCNLKCKAKHNNELAEQRKARERSYVSGLLRNVEILSTLIPEDSYEVETVSVQTLETMGFDPEGPNQRVTMYGEGWYRIGPYGYRPVEKSNEVELVRLD